MKVVLKNQLIVLIPETGAEQIDLALWKEEHTDHVLAAHANSGEGLALDDLGRREDACREPFPVISNSQDPAARLISNFAATPFTLDGRDYASVESFWQGLKFAKDSDRRRIAALVGSAAKDAGDEQGYGATVTYQDRIISVGTWEHWQLMRAACETKFAQNQEARTALLSTGERPLVHPVRRDSHTIPGVIMCEIWTKVRAGLRRA